MLLSFRGDPHWFIAVCALPMGVFFSTPPILPTYRSKWAIPRTPSALSVFLGIEFAAIILFVRDQTFPTRRTNYEIKDN